MKKIEYPKIQITLSKEEVDEINELLDRDTAVDGIPAVVGEDNCNKCPSCGSVFCKWDKFCSRCGQKLHYIESDVIPFDSEEVDA